VLAADRILAPLPADVRFDVERAPCLHAFPDEGLPGKLRHFLEAGPAPVYVGFGSMTDPDPGSTTRRLLDAIAGLGVRAVLSRGWAGLGDGPMPEDVFVTGPVSHAHLFPHVAVVVHHGGAGTTTTAARAGVPQVVVPHVLDQYYWAKRVADLGLGPPPLARRGLEPAGLVRAVGETLAAEVIADRARALGSQLRSEADRWPGAERLLTR
jgi:vancomycin aglycone glucosyltransferase